MEYWVYTHCFKTPAFRFILSFYKDPDKVFAILSVIPQLRGVGATSVALE